MSFKLGERVLETTTTTGTGAYSLAGAVTAYRAFSSVLSNGDTCFYSVWDNTDYESGYGTYTSAGNTLARTTVYKSSNSNLAVNWAAGTRNIMLTLPSKGVESLLDPARASGIVAQTSTGIYAARQILSSTQALSIANPSGAAGDPTLTLNLGAGIKDMASALVSRLPVSTVSASVLIVSTMRAQLIDIASAIAISVASANLVGSDFYCGIHNSAGSSVIVSGANLIDGVSSLTFQPNEGMILVCNGSVFRTIGRSLAPGVASDSAAGIIEIASRSENETGTSSSLAVTPGGANFLPGVAKAWVNFNGTGTVSTRVSHNVTSISDNATGDWTINFTTPFSSANYVPVGMSTDPASNGTGYAVQKSGSNATTASAIRVISGVSNASPIDSDYIAVAVFGDQ